MPQAKSSLSRVAPVRFNKKTRGEEYPETTEEPARSASTKQHRSSESVRKHHITIEPPGRVAARRHIAQHLQPPEMKAIQNRIHLHIQAPYMVRTKNCDAHPG